MKKRSLITVEVDAHGRVLLPPEVARRYGFTAGAKARLDEDAAGFRLSRSTQALARVYVEPTNACNLDCRTCMRNVWAEAPGYMSEEVFQRILEGIVAFDPRPSIFFGGFGEPLTHPRIVPMVAEARRAGAEVELITNGILLTAQMAQALMEAGLDRLWVSLDGASPQSYADVRLGAALPAVIENLRRLRPLRRQAGTDKPRLGIAFVAMKRNIADLPELVRLGKRLGADQFSISNVLPHTPELRDEMLYTRSMDQGEAMPSEWIPRIAFPRLDLTALSGGPILAALQERHLLAVARQDFDPGTNTCPFIEKASVSVRWDGAVSPCLALLHTHQSYLGERARISQAFAFGSLAEQPLAEIWRGAAYTDFRERLLAFDFSPCTLCNSCEMPEANLEDCFGNTLPTCGGCLWGQGFIQCP